MHWTLHWPWPLWMIVVAAVAFCLGSRWMFYDIRRRYGPLAPVAILILLVIVMIFIAGLPRKRDRDRVITLLAALGGSVILIIAQTRKQQHYVQMISDWAGSQGFTAESESRTEGVETLPEPLRQLPLFRRACEPATGYVLSRDEPSNRRTVLFEFETHQKTPAPRWMWANPNYDAQRITVIAIRHAKLGLPAFELRPAAVAEPPLEDDPPWERIELTNRPRFAGIFTLYAQDLAQLRRVLRSTLISELERDPHWCLEGLGDWFIAYRVRRAGGLWSLPRGKFETHPAPEQLGARIKTAEHLCQLLTRASLTS
jgi:hypothetical protein